MKNLKWASSDETHSSVLYQCALVAFVMEAFLLTAIGWREHWLAHPPRTKAEDENQFIEAQIFQVPLESKLVEEKKVATVPKQEAVLSRVAGQGVEKKESNPLQEENQTESGQKMAPNHGPVAVYAPPPVLPTYLQDRDLKTSVVIDFFVNAQGIATPRLVGSSGSEELDAIALKAVEKWQFRAAEKDHKPIESKVRLRILFEVK